MAINTEEVDVATCNACGKREYSADHTFNGLSGVAHAVTAGGGYPVSWYSCSMAPGHIGKAVRAAIDAGPGEPHDQ